MGRAVTRNTAVVDVGRLCLLIALQCLLAMAQASLREGADCSQSKGSCGGGRYCKLVQTSVPGGANLSPREKMQMMMSGKSPPASVKDTWTCTKLGCTTADVYNNRCNSSCWDCNDCHDCPDPCAGHKASSTCNPQLWSPGMPPFEGCDQDVGHSAADQTAALAQETQRGQFSQVMSDISHDEALLDEPIKLKKNFGLDCTPASLPGMCQALLTEYSRTMGTGFSGDICNHEFPLFDIGFGSNRMCTATQPCNTLQVSVDANGDPTGTTGQADATHQTAICKSGMTPMSQLHALMATCATPCFNDKAQSCCKLPRNMAGLFPCCKKKGCCVDQNHRRLQGAAGGAIVQVEGTEHGLRKYNTLMTCLSVGTKIEICIGVSRS